MQMTLHGDKDIVRMFANLKKAARGKTVRKPLRDGAKKIQQSAKRLAPRDEGDLRRAIRVRAMKRSRRRLAGIRIIVDADKLDRAGRTHAKRVAGAFQEYGTEHTPPQPFMRPAFDSHHHYVVADMMSEIRRLIREESAKAQAR